MAVIELGLDVINEKPKPWASVTLCTGFALFFVRSLSCSLAADLGCWTFDGTLSMQNDGTPVRRNGLV